jgi:hypothetical protein
MAKYSNLWANYHKAQCSEFYKGFLIRKQTESKLMLCFFTFLSELRSLTL